jgi:undecaprenyl diphosphate synthase
VSNVTTAQVPPDRSALESEARHTSPPALGTTAQPSASGQPDAAEHQEHGTGLRHVAIIMDGNGRWAQRRHMPRLEGHRQGVDNIHRIVPAAIDLGIEVLTLYAFSTENWGRPRDEVSGLMRLFTLISRRETENLHRQGVQVHHIGSLVGVSPALARAIQEAVEITAGNGKMRLNIAFNYGGRAEIVQAVQAIMRAGYRPEDVSELLISRYVYTGTCPDPDLIIRTAGEMRLSNFLLWQAAYSEYYASPKLWPDFGPDDLRAAVESFTGRHRKYGRL